jgi:lysozyme
MPRKSRKNNIYKRLFFWSLFINSLFIIFFIFQNPKWTSLIGFKIKTFFSETNIPKGNYMYGIDVSEYQGVINWNKLCSQTSNYKVGFTLIRATAGQNYRDKFYTSNWRESKNNNLVRGAYHYYRPNENSTKQAQNFITNVKIDPGDLPPVLDIEQLSKVQSMKSLKSGIKNWLNIIENHYGIQPILYTGTHFYRDYLNDFTKYPLWIANYNQIDNPLSEKDWIMWQFSDEGVINGISGPVDLDLFRGDKKDLNKYLLK